MLGVSAFNARVAQFPNRVKIAGRQWVWVRPARDWMGGEPMPVLTYQGLAESKATQPDALLLGLIAGGEAMDAMVVECCNTENNFEQKRGRYMPRVTGLRVGLGERWLLRQMTVQKGGVRSAYEALGLAEPTDPEVRVAVRHLEVLYTVPKELFEVIVRKHAIDGSEHFVKHEHFYYPWLTRQNATGRNLLEMLTREGHFLH